MKKVSKQIIISWIILTIWGIINIYSASYAQAVNHNTLVLKEIIKPIIVFLFLLIILFFIRKNSGFYYKLIQKNTVFLFILTIIFLIAVLVIGGIRGGAKSVIDLIVFDFQPLEMAKIIIILFLAKAFSDAKINLLGFKLDKLNKFNQLLKLGIITLVPVFLVFIEPDLGGAIILVFLIFIMFILNGVHVKKILKISLILVIIGLFLIFIISNSNVLHDYQMSRFSAWIDPFADRHETGWGIINAIIGISNGNLFGSGFLHSLQKSFVGTAIGTDYIFVLIAEEWGLFGVCFTIGMLVYLVSRCIRIGNYSPYRFDMLYCYGYGFLILLQVIVNVAGVCNLIPMTGVTLPFISNGVNSYLFLSLGLFFCVIIERRAALYYNKRMLGEW